MRLRWISYVITVLVFALLLLIMLLYQSALIDISLGDGKTGMASLQKNTSQGAIKFWNVYTQFGGGKELVAACLIVWFFGSRSKFFYYLAVFGLDKTIVNFYKLLLHQPRPYMIDKNIFSYSCSTAFGNPSGHCSASFVLTLVIFLDLFHGNSVPSFASIKFRSWGVYLLVIALCLIWAITIPYCRYLLGAHSLDQIVFGITNGIAEGLIIHLFFRDHIVNHIENVLSTQHLVPEERLALIRGKQLNQFQMNQRNKSDNLAQFNMVIPTKNAVVAFVFWLLYTILSIVAFLIVDADLTQTNSEIIMW
jgi:membrane-associated phospholipid phosphatase